MRVIVHITLEDDASEERLLAGGMSTETLREAYEEAFTEIVYTALDHRAKARLRVDVEDNTKETDK